MTDSYQRNAEDLLRDLASAKHEQRAIEAQVKEIQKKLTEHVLAGDLDHIKTESDNTYRYEDINFVYSFGRVTYDFAQCSDVMAARDTLKELEDTAKAMGAAEQKVGTPFWTVRA